MKTGFTKNTEDIRTIVRQTKECEDVYYSFDQLWSMAVEHFGVAYSIFICLEDDGEYVGHYLLNTSEMTMNRLTITAHYILPEKRNYSVFYWFWIQLEKAIEKILKPEQVMRMQLQIEKSNKKLQMHIKEFGNFKRDGILKKFARDKDFVQFYKMIGGGRNGR